MSVIGKSITSLFGAELSAAPTKTEQGNDYAFYSDHTVVTPRTTDTFDLGNDRRLERTRYAAANGQPERDYFDVYDSKLGPATASYFTKGADQIVDVENHTTELPGSQLQTISERDNDDDGRVDEKVTRLKDESTGLLVQTTVEKDTDSDGTLDSSQVFTDQNYR